MKLTAWWPIRETAHTTQHLIQAADDRIGDLALSMGVLIDGEPTFWRVAGSSIPGASAYAEVIYAEAEVRKSDMQQTDRADAMAEDVEWLLSWGVHPLEIAQRVGSTPRNLTRMFARHGWHDLAKPFARRCGTCVDCGGDCGLDATRCTRCSHATRRAA